MVAGATAETVARASFWLTYSHVVGSVCRSGKVKGSNAVQKAIDFRLVTGNGYVPQVGEFSEMRYVQVGNCGSTAGKQCASRVREPYARRWKLELASVTVAQHDKLACECGKAPKHDEEQDTNPGDVELWASTVQGKWLGGQQPVTPSQRIFAKVLPCSSWEWHRERALEKNPVLLSAMDRIEAEIMRRERPVTYMQGLIESGSPSLTFFGDKRTVHGTRARELKVRSRAIGPGVRKRPLPSGRVLKRAPDGTPIEFQGARRTRAIHVCDRNPAYNAHEFALWFGSELESYIEEREFCKVAPPLGRLPFDRRSVPELYRQNGRIYTMDKWAAFQFCTLLLRILATVPR